MEHVNAKYLRALADGKTIEGCFPNMEGDELFWMDVHPISTLAKFLLSGVQDQDQEYFVELRIKGEE